MNERVDRPFKMRDPNARMDFGVFFDDPNNKIEVGNVDTISAAEVSKDDRVFVITNSGNVYMLRRNAVNNTILVFNGNNGLLASTGQVLIVDKPAFATVGESLAFKSIDLKQGKEYTSQSSVVSGIQIYRNVEKSIRSFCSEMQYEGEYFQAIAREYLEQNEISHSTESFSRPSEVITSRGSIYRFLDDGRTQRYKKAADTTSAPQDILVFLPPWAFVKKSILKVYPEFEKRVRDEDGYFEQLLESLHNRKQRTMDIVDENGKKLLTNQEVQSAKQVFLHIENEPDVNKREDILLPVAKNPHLGWRTYDTRDFNDATGNAFTERHIGNKVISIKYA